MADTTTTLNPGSGGDTLDETLAVQSDGATSAKRARVDIGFEAQDQRGRLVSASTPLPTSSTTIEFLLSQILTELQVTRQLLESFISS